MSTITAMLGSVTAIFLVMVVAGVFMVMILAVDSLLTKRAMGKNDEWKKLLDQVNKGLSDFNNKEQK